MTHDFDWARAPPPWDAIGDEWRKKCLGIAAAKPPLPGTKPHRPWVRAAGDKGRAAQRETKNQSMSHPGWYGGLDGNAAG